MYPRQIILFGFVLFLALTLFSPKRTLPPPDDIGDKLTFETIESSGGGAWYHWKTPAAYVLWQQSDITEIDQPLSVRTRAILNRIDFSKDAVIGVFLGGQPIANYAVVIESCGIKDGRIIIIAQFWENPPGAIELPAESSPYQIVKIKKDVRFSSKPAVELYSYVKYFEPAVDRH